MDDQQPVRVGERPFLTRFHSGDRGAIGQEFHEACRLGARTPSDVIACVRTRAQAICGMPFATPENKERARSLLAAIAADPKGAREFARAAIEWAELPPAERDRIRAARSDQHRRAHVASLPVTERQRAYLKALGHLGEPANRLEASELIDQLRAEQRQEAIR